MQQLKDQIYALERARGQQDIRLRQAYNGLLAGGAKRKKKGKRKNRTTSVTKQRKKAKRKKKGFAVPYYDDDWARGKYGDSPYTDDTITPEVLQQRREYIDGIYLL